MKNFVQAGFAQMGAGMVSRRKLFSMVLMMAVILALFLFTQIYRNAVNDYDTNEYAEEIVFRQADVFDALEEKKDVPEGKQVALIGKETGGFGNIVLQWCTYSKRSLRCFSDLTDYFSQKNNNTEILCIDPECLSCAEDGKRLEELYDRNMVVIFGGLPDMEELGNSPELCKVLGIEKVQKDRVELTGIYMYQDFLLGGDGLYQAKTQEETARQDFDLSIPWYELGGRTKKYIIGLLEDESIKREEQPAIVWRNTLGSTRVFAVNGDFLCEETGLGFLDAMMSESYSYVIYPIVNAQNLSIADYPSFTSENEEMLQKIYSNSHRMLLQNIIWPGLISLSAQSGFRMTCFLTPQFFYSDNNMPQTDTLTFYLKQIKEQQGEAGWSAGGKDDISAADKWSQDEKFFEDAGSTYVYSAAFAAGRQKDELSELNDEETVDVRTIVGEGEDEDFLLSFVSEKVTYQGITHRADSYNFSDDLRNRSLQTALGYTNILLDMGCVSWPESAEEYWENYSRKVSGNIGTWWKPFSCFDRTTVTESDSRLRSFLALDYEDEYEDGSIRLRVENREGTVYFLLRTHDKKVDSVSGGDFLEIEEDAYIISAREDEVEISLTN